MDATIIFSYSIFILLRLPHWLSWMVTHVRPSSATLTNGHFQDAMVSQTTANFCDFCDFCDWGKNLLEGVQNRPYCPIAQTSTPLARQSAPRGRGNKAPSGRHVSAGSANGSSLVADCLRRISFLLQYFISQKD